MGLFDSVLGAVTVGQRAQAGSGSSLGNASDLMGMLGGLLQKRQGQVKK